MQIRIASADPQLISQLAEEIPGDLKSVDLAEQFIVDAPSAPSTELQRGDLVTVATIVLSAVSAGGALTVAMSKEGFLTRLAKVLEVWVNRKVEVKIDLPNGEKIQLSGSAAHIERILKTHLKS